MTSYEQVYDAFLNHIDDVDMLYPRPDEIEIEYQERIDSLLLSTLKSAVAKFFHSKTSLERDDAGKMFVNDLRPVEIEILAFLMLKEYYRKKLNFLVQLKHSFSDKDWKMHSKSDQMNQYRNLLQEIDAEIKTLIVNNSMFTSDGQIDGWWDNE